MNKTFVLAKLNSQRTKLLHGLSLGTFKQRFHTEQAEEPTNRNFIRVKLNNLQPRFYTSLACNLYKIVLQNNHTLGYYKLKHNIGYNKTLTRDFRSFGTTTIFGKIKYENKESIRKIEDFLITFFV